MTKVTPWEARRRRRESSALAISTGPRGEVPPLHEQTLDAPLRRTGQISLVCSQALAKRSSRMTDSAGSRSAAAVCLVLKPAK